MDLSELTVRLLLLFFPGIVCHLVVDSLTVHRERKVHEVFLQAFVLGISSYALYSILLFPFGITRNADGFQFSYPDVSFFQSMSTEEGATSLPGKAVKHPLEIRFWEISWVAIVAIALGVLISVVAERHLLHNLARKIGITKKFGEYDVWMFAFNAPEISWATVRDVSCDMMFQGYIRAWSDTGETREILLSQVNVYNETTGEPLYKADNLYLSRDRNNLTIEMHNPPEEIQWPTNKPTTDTKPTTDNANQSAE